MKKLLVRILSKAGAVLTLLAFFTTNVAAQSLPLGGAGQQSADTIIRRLDEGGRDRVAWLARAREGLLEASAEWERPLLAAGGTPGAMTAGLASSLDKAYAERLVSGFFEEAASAEAPGTQARERTKSISASFPELALVTGCSLSASVTERAGLRSSARAYEGKALAVAELASEVAGGSYSEYSLAAMSKAGLPDNARYVSATAVRERSLTLAGEVSAILLSPEAAQNPELHSAARGITSGLSAWEKIEALISAKKDTQRQADSTKPDSQSSSLEAPVFRQSWLSYGSSQDALEAGLLQRFLRDKDAWLTSAETQLARLDTQAQFLGADADAAARLYLTVVVPTKDLGQVTAEHREAESAKAPHTGQKTSASSEGYPPAEPPSAHRSTAPTQISGNDNTPVQKPNLLKKALQLLEAIVQSEPMEKVESSNRSSSEQTPIFDDQDRKSVV